MPQSAMKVKAPAPQVQLQDCCWISLILLFCIDLDRPTAQFPNETRETALARTLL
jgi:hypothetical protein